MTHAGSHTCIYMYGVIHSKHFKLVKAPLRVQYGNYCVRGGRDQHHEHNNSVLHELKVLLLVCSPTGTLLSLNFVPRQLFLEVERRSVSAHSAINSYRMQYGNYRMRDTFDTPTQSATNGSIVVVLYYRRTALVNNTTYQYH